jgi:hypothetical protein
VHEALLRAVGATAERIGDDRAAVLAALPAVLGAPLDAGCIASADAFLAGLRLPDVRSPL